MLNGCVWLVTCVQPRVAIVFCLVQTAIGHAMAFLDVVLLVVVVVHGPLPAAFDHKLAVTPTTETTLQTISNAAVFWILRFINNKYYYVFLPTH